MGNRVFSLAINEYQTKLAHIEREKNQIKLLSLGYDNTVPTYFSNPTDQSIELQSQLILRLYNKLNIKENKVQIIIPDSMSYSQLLVLPKLKEDDLEQAIRLQVDEIIPLPIADTNIDHEIVTELPDNKILVLFVAVERKLADHIAKTMEFTKLEPISLENELSVLGRFFAEIYPFTKDASIIINVGFDAISFYLINPPFPFFQFTRIIKIGISTFLKDLKMNMNIDGAKSLEIMQTIGLNPNGSVNIAPVVTPIVNEIIHETKKTIQMSNEKYKTSVKHVYLLNYDSHIAHLHEVMQNQLSIPSATIPLGNLFIDNPVSQSFKNNLSSFLPVIAGHFR